MRYKCVPNDELKLEAKYSRLLSKKEIARQKYVALKQECVHLLKQLRQIEKLNK